MREDPLTAGRNIRPDLLYLRLRDPASSTATTPRPPTTPDVAYARGDHAVAVRGYLAQLRADPARLHAWTGLGIATGARGTLTRCPEVVYALQGRLAHGREPLADPLRLARWLSRVSIRDLGVQV